MDPRSTISTAHVLGVAVVAASVLAAIAFLGPAAYEAEAAELQLERGFAGVPPSTIEARGVQAARLGAYAWIDREKGVVALPIERAMELTVSELARESRPKEGGR